MPLSVSIRCPVLIGLLAALALCGVASNALALTKLTHVNLAFANPSGSGAFLSNGNPACMDASATDINYVMQKAHAAGVKVWCRWPAA